jgi:exonuclease VII small subunit
MSNFGFLNPLSHAEANVDPAAAKPDPPPTDASGEGPPPSADRHRNSLQDVAGQNSVVELLERHNREWKKAFDLLERNRANLIEAEEQVSTLHIQLEVLVPIVQQSEQDLQSAMVRPGAFEFSPAMMALFDGSSTAIEQLEALVRALAEHLARRRTAWEQYCQTIEQTRGLLTNPPS